MMRATEGKELYFLFPPLQHCGAQHFEPAVTIVIWLKGLHSAHPALSDVDTLFIRGAFPFNATLQSAKGSSHSDYNPNFGLTRQVMYSQNSGKSPQENPFIIQTQISINLRQSWWAICLYNSL